MQTEAPGKPPERRRRRGARSLIRAALFAGAAALLFSLTAASASAAPAVTVDPTTNLTTGTTVSVTGTGFTAPTVLPVGLYVGQGALVDGTYLTAPPTDGKYVRLGGPTPDTLLNPDGSFETQIEVSTKFTSGTTEVNCLQVDCIILTWQAHGNPGPANPVFTSTPLVFRAAVAPRINVVKRNQLRIGRKARVLRLAAIRCGSEPCAVRKPNRVVVRVGKRKMRLALAGPRRVAAGKRAQLRLRVTGKAARALVGRRARVRFRVVVRSDSGNQARVVNRVLVGARKVSHGR